MAQEILNPVKVASTTNIILSEGLEQDSINSKIDGKKIVVGDRILLKSQTDPKENGVYVMSSTILPSGKHQLDRASDFAASSLHTSTIVFVRSGDALGDTGFILSNDEEITVGTSSINFKRFTINSVENLQDVSSFLTIRSEKGYPLTNAELDNNFKYLGNALDDKVDLVDYSAEAVVDKINSLSYADAGINASQLRGMYTSLTPAIDNQIVPTNQEAHNLYSIPVRDEFGNIISTLFTGDLDGTAYKLRKGTTGRDGDWYTNASNIDAGVLSISYGGTGGTTAAQARQNLRVVDKAGDTMTGRLIFHPSESTGYASLNIAPGVQTPLNVENGDVWTSGEHIFFKLNETTQKVARLNSPTFTGDPKIDAPVRGLDSEGNITEDSTLIATIGFVQQFKEDYVDPQLFLKAPKDSAALTTKATLAYSQAEYPSVSNSTTKLATTQWVQEVKSDFLQNTIVPTYETIANVALKAPKASPVFTGTPILNENIASVTTNSKLLATTEWVQSVKSDLLTNTIVPNYATYSYVNTSARWMGANKFVSTSTPTSSDGVIGDIWIQTDEYIDYEDLQNVAGFVQKAGSTMTGYLTLHADPTSDYHAASKHYVDQEILSTKNNWVAKSGSTMTGLLTLSGAPTSNLHAATKKYVDDQMAAVDVSGVAVMKNVLASQLMIGKLRTPQTLITDPDDTLATKKYVADTVTANTGAPIATIAYYPVSNLPVGWMECDGRSLDKNIYAHLFAIIGYMYGGSGDNFKLPDLRGEFIRSWDHGRGVNRNRNLGSWERGTAVLFDPNYGSYNVTSPIARYNYTGATNGSWTDPDNATDKFGVDYVGTDFKDTYPHILRAEVNNLAEPREVYTHGWGGGSARPRNVALVAAIKVTGGVDDPNQILASNVLLDIAGKLNKSGGTMTGSLTLAGAPASDLHAATKKYVDDSIINADIASKEYVDTEIANISQDGGAPVGSILYYASTNVPAGWMECDGRTLDKTVYTTLFARIGYTYGGSGNNFKIPDLRGEFIRGWDHGRGVDSARNIGSSQISSIVPFDPSRTSVNPAGLLASTDYATQAEKDLNILRAGFDLVDYSLYGYVRLAQGAASSDPWVGNVNSGGWAVGGTRPRNVALIACIKAFGAADTDDLIALQNILNQLNNKLDKSGGTMTGALLLSGAPTAASHAATKSYVDSAVSNLSGSKYKITYGNTVYAVGYTDEVGSWNNGSNYVDVFPPSGWTMGDLIAFVPSISVIHFSGRVDGNDSIRCTWTTYSDRIRVWCQNTEQRSTPAINYMAVWTAK